MHPSEAGIQALGHAARAEVIHGIQAVFVVAAPLAALALLVVLRLPELHLRGARDRSRAPRPAPEAARSAA